MACHGLSFDFRQDRSGSRTWEAAERPPVVVGVQCLGGVWTGSIVVRDSPTGVGRSDLLSCPCG